MYGILMNSMLLPVKSHHDDAFLKSRQQAPTARGAPGNPDETSEMDWQLSWSTYEKVWWLVKIAPLN